MPHLDEIKLRILETIAAFFAAGNEIISDHDLREVFQKQNSEHRFDSIINHFVCLGIIQPLEESSWKVHAMARKLWDRLDRVNSRAPTPGADEMPYRTLDNAVGILDPTAPYVRIWESGAGLFSFNYNDVFRCDRMLYSERQWFHVQGDDERASRFGDGPVRLFAQEVSAQEATEWFIGQQQRLQKSERWRMELPSNLSMIPRIKDPIVDLLQWAETELKGKQRKMLEVLCDKGGMIPFPDLATILEWNAPFENAFNSLRQAVNKRLKSAGQPFVVARQNNSALLRMSKKGQE